MSLDEKPKLGREDLWEECTTCNGSGKQEREKGDRIIEEPCHWCLGYGEQPTEFGNAVKELIERMQQ